MTKTVRDIEKGIRQVLRAEMSRHRLAGWFIIISLMVMPAVIALLFIRAYGVNVPFWDQFDFIPLFDKAYAGQLSLADLLVQHNEHRIFLPRLVMLALGTITHYNVVAEMYLSWFLLLLVGFVLLRAYAKAFGTSQSTFAKFVPVTWLLFSLRQYSNLLWGFQIAFPMTVLFAVLALYLLEMSRNIGLRFSLAIISGMACTFSMSNGLLVWPLGLVQILYSFRFRGAGSNRLCSRMASIWCLVGIVAFAIYFVGFTYPAHHPSPSYVIYHPLSSLTFLLACVGSPLAVESYTAMGVGALLLLLYLYTGIKILRRESRSQPLVPLSLSLLLFGLSSALLIVLGRAGFGLHQIIDPHYTTMTIPGVVGGYLLLISLRVEHRNIKPFLTGALLCLIILGIAVSYPCAIVAGNGIRTHSNTNAYYLSTFEIQSDENLAKLHSDVKRVRDGAYILKKYKLNVFGSPRLEPEKLTLVHGTTHFGIDTINGRQLAQQSFHVIIDAQQEKTITIFGYAVDQAVGEPAGGVFINVDDQMDIPALYGRERSDVADYFDDSDYRFSGFSASFATSVLGEGQHTLSLKIITADKRGYYEPDLKIILEVR